MATLFEPCRIAGLEIRNRLAMAPMTRCRCPEGEPTDLVVDYYARRAAGEIGLIITEGALVDHPLAGAYPNVPYLRRTSIEGWRRVVDAAHGEGSCVAAQIWHCGPMVQNGIGAVDTWNDGKLVARAASVSDKETLLAAYSEAASSARAAGFDAVELHCAHGYLLDSFLRAGDRGFVIEVIEETRRQLEGDLPIIERFSTWKVDDYEANYIESPAQLESLLNPMLAAGVDILHPSVRRFWQSPFGPDDDLGLAGWTRKVSGAPTITVGGVGLDTKAFRGRGPESLSELERRLEAGYFDLVAVGRALITEPDWARKVREERWDAIEPWRDSAAEEVFP